MLLSVADNTEQNSPSANLCYGVIERWRAEAAVKHHLPGFDPGLELSCVQPRHGVIGCGVYGFSKGTCRP